MFVPINPLLIVKVGDTFNPLAARLGDFEAWIAAGIGPTTLRVDVVDPRDGPPLPDPAGVAGAIVTGSHAMVTDRADWSERLAGWLRQAVARRVPVLGICYGHQLLADALGGVVGDHPGGLELGTVGVARTPAARGDPLFGALPDAFAAHVVHRQSVRQLPAGAVVLAANDFEPHHAFRFGDAAWGVQFHPEFSAAAIAGYVVQIRPDAPVEPAVATDAAASILPAFARIAAAQAVLGDGFGGIE